MRRLTSGQVHVEFIEALTRVDRHGERILIRHKGRNVAALVPARELEIMERVIAQYEDLINLKSMLSESSGTNAHKSPTSISHQNKDSKNGS